MNVVSFCHIHFMTTHHTFFHRIIVMNDPIIYPNPFFVLYHHGLLRNLDHQFNEPTTAPIPRIPPINNQWLSVSAYAMIRG